MPIKPCMQDVRVWDIHLQAPERLAREHACRALIRRVQQQSCDAQLRLLHAPGLCRAQAALPEVQQHRLVRGGASERPIDGRKRAK
jgi:hypothetical protein